MVTNRGALPSSLIAYLCGISEVNPLPAHYRCPSCHHIEIAPKGKKYRVCGSDLIERVCPKCGSKMIADGFDILPEVCMGLYFELEPDFIMNFAPSQQKDVLEFIRQRVKDEQFIRAGVKAELEDGTVRRGVHPGGIYIIPKNADISDLTTLREPDRDDELQLNITEEDYHKLDYKLKKMDFLPHQQLGLLHDLEAKSGFDHHNIRLDDVEVLRVFLDVENSFMQQFSDLYRSIIQKAKPMCFSDLARVDGLAHGAGTWTENGSELMGNGKTVRDIISCRDDIMQYLMSAGVSKETSYKAMKKVKSGHTLTAHRVEEMRSAGVPDWFLDSCNKIQYAYPWAQCVEYTLVNWKLAYYWLHYPDVYKEFC